MNTYVLCDLESCVNKNNCKLFDSEAKVKQGFSLNFKYVCNEDSNYKWQIPINDNIKDNTVDNTLYNTNNNTEVKSDSANNAQTQEN